MGEVAVGPGSTLRFQTEQVDGTLTEVGDTAPKGGELSGCSNAGKKP